MKEGVLVKDRRHYGELVKDAVIEVTPEQAGAWLTTRPPPPVMWSRDVPDNEKSHRLAKLMLAGEWDNDMPVEPIMVSGDYGHVLGGHHRLSAVTHTGKPQMLRVQFYSKPPGWDTKLRDVMAAEFVPDPRPACPICAWQGGDIDEHVKRSHREGRF